MQSGAALSRRAIMPSLGACFCHDRLMDNPCSFPAERPHLAGFLPDLFRVSTCRALPCSTEHWASAHLPRWWECQGQWSQQAGHAASYLWMLECRDEPCSCHRSYRGRNPNVRRWQRTAHHQGRVMGTVCSHTCTQGTWDGHEVN